MIICCTCECLKSGKLSRCGRLLLSLSADSCKCAHGCRVHIVLCVHYRHHQHHHHAKRVAGGKVPFTNHSERIRAEYELRERERAFERAKAMADPTGRMDCVVDARVRLCLFWLVYGVCVWCVRVCACGACVRVVVCVCVLHGVRGRYTNAPSTPPTLSSI